MRIPLDFLFNSMASRRCGCNLILVILKRISRRNTLSISSETTLSWLQQDLTDDQSTLVQVMAWCRQATSHYLSQFWTSSMLLYGITLGQWVNLGWWSYTFYGWASWTYGYPEPTHLGPFYQHGLSLITAWINNCIHYKMYNEIACPFLNFNSDTTEVWEYI